METSLAVKNVLAANGITHEILDQMVQKSAIVTHKYGNRRFENWVFGLSGNVVVTMRRSMQRSANNVGNTKT